jgi:endonuclease YncB( thermonuclease family)
LAGRREGDTKLDGSQPAHPTVEVEDDTRFPFDEDRNANVQVYFTGTTEATASTRFNLNRMLVRSGWALVDLHTPTAINLQQWLNDQEYAKRARLGLWGNQATLDWVYRACSCHARASPRAADASVVRLLSARLQVTG